MALRKTHTAKFKAKVALEAIKGEKTASQIASEYGVHPVMVSKWKKAACDLLEKGFLDGRSPPKEADGFAKEQLLAQIGSLKVELDWLKKRL